MSRQAHSEGRLRQWLQFLFFFAFAGLLWLLHALKDTYEVTVPITLQLTNVPQDVIVTEEPPKTLTLRLRDKGYVLMIERIRRISETRKEQTVSLNFAKHRNNDTQVRIDTRTLLQESKLAWYQQTSGTTKIIDIRPETIEYIYCTGERRQIPVRLRAQITTKLGYIAIDTLISPTMVTAYAPPELLKELSTADTEKRTFNDVSDTLHTTLPLARIRGVKFVPASINLRTTVDMLTEKEIEVPVQGTNLPPNTALRLFPARVKLHIQVPASRFGEITADDFSAIVPYESLNLNGENCEPYIMHTLREVQHVRIEPQTLDFLLEETEEAN